MGQRFEQQRLGLVVFERLIVKNTFREQLGQKPRIIKVHHFWVCANANARGEGNTPRQAYRYWKTAYTRWANNPRRIKT